MVQLSPNLIQFLAQPTKPSTVSIELEVIPGHLSDAQAAIKTLGWGENIFHTIEIGPVQIISLDQVPVKTLTKIASIPFIEMVHYDHPVNFFENPLQGIQQAKAAGYRIRDFFISPKFKPLDIFTSKNKEVAPGWLGTKKVYNHVGMDQADKDGYTGKNTKVCIIDTGIFSAHACFQNNPIRGQATISRFTLGQRFDAVGHGSWCAAAVGGDEVQAPNGLMTRGMSKAQLYCIKALRGPGMASESDTIKGFEIGLKQFNPDIFSFSAGGSAQQSYKTSLSCKVMAELNKMGKVVVVAAGNEGPKASTINDPGISPDVITVGASSIMDKDKVSWFSSRGPTIDNLAKPDVLAPGGGRAVEGTNPEEYLYAPTSPFSSIDREDRTIALRIRQAYGPARGTSMATPAVAGILARVRDYYVATKKTFDTKTLNALFLTQGGGVVNWSWF